MKVIYTNGHAQHEGAKFLPLKRKNIIFFSSIFLIVEPSTYAADHIEKAWLGEHVALLLEPRDHFDADLWSEHVPPRL